jgi:hypothetical protein
VHKSSGKIIIFKQFCEKCLSDVSKVQFPLKYSAKFCKIVYTGSMILIERCPDYRLRSNSLEIANLGLKIDVLNREVSSWQRYPLWEAIFLNPNLLGKVRFNLLKIRWNYLWIRFWNPSLHLTNWLAVCALKRNRYFVGRLQWWSFCHLCSFWYFTCIYS